MKIHRTQSRRSFLSTAAAATATFAILPGRLSQSAEAAANNKINIAGIGIGGRGANVVDELAGLGHNMVALCDVDTKYAAKQFAKYPNAKQFVDYRDMLDKMGKEIDAVII